MITNQPIYESPKVEIIEISIELEFASSDPIFGNPSYSEEDDNWN